MLRWTVQNIKAYRLSGGFTWPFQATSSATTPGGLCAYLGFGAKRLMLAGAHFSNNPLYKLRSRFCFITAFSLQSFTSRWWGLRRIRPCCLFLILIGCFGPSCFAYDRMAIDATQFEDILQTIAHNWLTLDPNNGGDINGDDVVDYQDFALLARWWEIKTTLYRYLTQWADLYGEESVLWWYNVRGAK